MKFSSSKIVIVIAVLFTLISSIANAALPIDEHKLMRGTLSSEAAEERLFEFIREMNRSKKSKKSSYWIYKNFIEDIGVTRIKKYLEAVNPSCHGVSHSLGKVIGEKEPELYKGMQICNDTCTYGCIHGVFKVYFNKLGKDYHQSHQGHQSHQAQKPGHEMPAKMDMKKNMKMDSGLSKAELAKFSKDVNHACDNPVSVVEDFFRGNCAHGVGHAMGMLAPDVSQATEYCKVFDEKSMQYYCETGVFMELAKKIKKELYPKKVNRQVRLNKAVEYCSSVSQSPSACLRFIAWRNKKMDHVKQYAANCDKLDSIARSGCFNAMGYASRSYLAKNPSKVNSVCAFGEYADQKACISGIAFMKKGQRHRKAIKAACGNLKDKRLKQGCLNQIQHYYYKPGNRMFKTLL